jgi:arginine-tRNA-protein transferase
MTRAARELQLFRSPPHACSYLSGEIASSAFVDPAATLDPASYGALLELGFRRSGRHVYRPHCPACQACVAARIPVDRFRPRRSQRRAAAANRDLRVARVPARFTAEQFALFQDYTTRRHMDGEMANMKRRQCEAFLSADWCATEFLEFRLADRLVCVAVTDRVPNALSALYTFFDPALRGRSLGVYAILQQLALARADGLEYLYLGYWIGTAPKMRYKGDYRPVELLVDGQWRCFAAGDPLPGGAPGTQRS